MSGYFIHCHRCVHQDLTVDLIPLVLHPIMNALQDDDDDVRAIAASALLPVTEAVVKIAPEKVRQSTI